MASILTSWRRFLSQSLALLCSTVLVASWGAAHAQMQDYRYLTGVEALTDSQFAFPDGPPRVDGSAVILGPANTPRGILAEVAYPPGGNYNEPGITRSVVRWDMVRLSCDGAIGCNNAGGPEGSDHDPIFFIRQGNEAYGWQIADNPSGGSYLAGSFGIGDRVGASWTDISLRVRDPGFFPALNQRYFVEISYTFLPDRVDSTMNIVLNNNLSNRRSIRYSFQTYGGFDPSQPYSFGILNEDNRGERYLLEGAHVAPLPIPEPLSAVLMGAGLLIVRQRLRRS